MRPNIGFSLGLQIFFLKSIQCNIASNLFTYCIIDIIIWLHSRMSHITCSEELCTRLLCLGWYKTCRGWWGFPTHNVNSWAFSSVLVVLSYVILNHVLSLSFFGVSIPCHYHIPPCIDKPNNIRLLMSYVNGLPYITEPVDQRRLKNATHMMIINNTKKTFIELT